MQDFEDWDDEEAVAEMLGGFFNSCGSRKSNPILPRRAFEAICKTFEAGVDAAGWNVIRVYVAPSFEGTDNVARNTFSARQVRPIQ